MTHQLMLELPDEVYRPLVEKAQAAGKTVEAVAQLFLAESVQSVAPGSRVGRWIGALESKVPDAAERHDDYLGQALYEELQSDPGQ